MSQGTLSQQTEKTGVPLAGVEHRPAGTGDPYNAGPTARNPFAPEAGMPCEIGAITWPAGAARRVWVEWQATDASGEVAAEHVEDLDGHSHWRATLPPFSENSLVEYSLHASSSTGVQTQGPFTFSVAGWHALDRIAQVSTVNSGLVLGIAVSHGVPPVSLRLCFTGEGTLKLSLESGYEEMVGADEYSQEPLILSEEGAALHVSTAPFGLRVTNSKGIEVLSLAPGGLRVLVAEGKVSKLSATFSSPDDEAFMGFGERFNALNQRGNTLDVMVYEQYKKQGKRTYIPVPFFVSSRGYGLYLDTSRYVTYDLALSDPAVWSFSSGVGAGQPYLDFYLFVGEPKQVISAFTGLTVRPALPPEWAFGLWMSSNEWNSQAVVTEQVRRTLEHDIPASVLVIEAWSDESTFYIWNDARYEAKPSDQPMRYGDFTFPAEGKWPDPKAMVDYLHEQGIRLLLWQVPVLKTLEEPHPQQDIDEAYMLEQGYAVREASGEPYRIEPFWFRGGLVPDFTSDEAAEWWLSRRAYLLEEVGIDGFKTDGGEHLWGQNLVFSDGKTGDEAINLFPSLYSGSYYRFANEKRGEAVIFSRAGFTGSQAFPCHWAGDEDSTWEAFRASIFAGLTAGVSGIPFWGWDIAGFSGDIPSAELYLRATAMSCFCPIMQYHSEFNDHKEPNRDRTPWNIQARTGDTDVIPIFRKYARLRMTLLPYIYAEARKSSQTGVPLMRALSIEYPDDAAVYDYPYQYHLGDSLLVAPVTTEGATHQTVYLPAGEWLDFWTKQSYSGPAVVNYAVPKDVIPVFARPDGPTMDYRP
ncbi:MAG: TIM-barrel domain-containing protein [Chloroflexota bacterium]